MSYLSKVSLSEDDTCFRHRNEMESISHVPVMCSNVKEFWNPSSRTYKK